MDKVTEADADRLMPLLAQVRLAISQAILGQSQAIEEALIAILAGGHAIVLGVPGLGKTQLVTTLGVVLGLHHQRIQCTPDLMPSDILGTEILDLSPSGQRDLRFVKGPVFAQLLMVDEINRASSKTQSALLQAMQEKIVTITGVSYSLPKPFHVLATQNPLEYEGTYPLPEAQLDRFLMRIDMTYPDEETERSIILATTSLDEIALDEIISAPDLMKAQLLVRAMPIGRNVLDTILKVTRGARPETSLLPIAQHVAWGPGLRASQALSLAARARALLDGRTSPSLDDVMALIRPVLRHRMSVSMMGRADGITVEDVLTALIADLG